MTPQLPTMHRINPIRHMACLRGMGAMRLMGNTRRPTRPALDAESAEVLGNIKRSLSKAERALL